MFISDKWNNYDTDIARRSLGSCFLTKEEAKFEIERRRVEATLLKYGRRRFKNGERNYYFFYDHEDNLIRKTIVDTCQSQGIIFFDNDELIDQAIKEAGKDNIKKYIFGVYDEGKCPLFPLCCCMSKEPSDWCLEYCPPKKDEGNSK